MGGLSTLWMLKVVEYALSGNALLAIKIGNAWILVPPWHWICEAYIKIHVPYLMNKLK